MALVSVLLRLNTSKKVYSVVRYVGPLSSSLVHVGLFAVVMACRGCCCVAANEPNARFVMLALLILLYLLCGAAVFSALERPTERQAKEQWTRRLVSFILEHNLNRSELEDFLRYYEEANVAGIRVDTLGPRWDFTGAFYFVWTVVSTIGFGMTTPATAGGKLFLIFYGLLGCACTILFFNLFLERTITFLALLLRSCHRLHPPRVAPGPGRQRRAAWKPSVYSVMLMLGLAAVAISCSASVMYSAVEGWAYLDALYFCFVAFSTIGFGDVVSGQREAYGERQAAYRLANFLFILMGVCCIYSLFNVISIIIKQTLNWLLRRLVYLCCSCHPITERLTVRRDTVMHIGSSHLQARRLIPIDTDGLNESEMGQARRLSEEMTSMRGFLAANKVTLALMQKQLSESANENADPLSASTNRDNGFSCGVGALGIMNNRLAETSID